MNIDEWVKRKVFKLRGWENIEDWNCRLYRDVCNVDRGEKGEWPMGISSRAVNNDEKWKQRKTGGEK